MVARTYPNNYDKQPSILFPGRQINKLKVIICLLVFVFAGNTYSQEVDTIPISTQQSDSAVIAFLAQENVPTTNNNKIKLLKSGQEKFEDLFEIIRNAEHHVHLEYFNFRNDSIANILFDLLAEKAAEGVEIRTIFDAFGNWSNNKPLKKKHLKEIRKRGIEIVAFDPLRFPYLNHIFHRDHRKIAVIDGKVAYTGGMNVADYYIEGLPKIGAWRDMHVRIEGDAVGYLQEIFLTIWNKTAKQKIEGEVYFPSATDTLPGFNKAVAIVDRAPKKLPKLMRRVYAKAINSAKEKIQIVNPYFLPTHSIRESLKKAIDRGVEVEIMLSSKADIAFTPEGSIYVAHKLMKRGAEVYLYDGGFHHSKIMMVDDLFCTVGTTNLDSRSLRFDYEVNAFIFDKETTKELIEVFEKDKENSTQMTPETWKKRSKWKKIVGWCANLFTPFL